MVKSRSRKRQTPNLYAKQYRLYHAIQTYIDASILKIEHPLSQRSVNLLLSHLLGFYTLDPNVYNRTKFQKVRRQAYLTKGEASDVILRSLRLYRDTPLEDKPRIFADISASSGILHILHELHTNCYRVTRRYLEVYRELFSGRGSRSRSRRL